MALVRLEVTCFDFPPATFDLEKKIFGELSGCSKSQDMKRILNKERTPHA